MHANSNKNKGMINTKFSMPAISGWEKEDDVKDRPKRASKILVII